MTATDVIKSLTNFLIWNCTRTTNHMCSNSLCNGTQHEANWISTCVYAYNAYNPPTYEN